MKKQLNPIGYLYDNDEQKKLCTIYRPYDICKFLGLSSTASAPIMNNCHKKLSKKYKFVKNETI